MCARATPAEATDGPAASVPSSADGPAASVPSSADGPAASVPSSADGPAASVPSSADGPAASVPSSADESRPSPAAYVSLGVAAVLLGVATAVGVWLFNQAFGLVHRVVFDRIADALAPLGRWTLSRSSRPAASSSRLIVRFMRPEPLGALPHVIDGVVEHDGRLNGHNAAVAIGGAAAGIGFGMPLGADTPSAMIGGHLASIVAIRLALADGVRPGARRGRRRGRDLVDVPGAAGRGGVRVRGGPGRLRRDRVRRPDAHRGRRGGLRHLRARRDARDLPDPAAGHPLGRDPAPLPRARGPGGARRDRLRRPSCSGRSPSGHESRCRRWAGWSSRVRSSGSSRSGCPRSWARGRRR